MTKSAPASGTSIASDRGAAGAVALRLGLSRTVGISGVVLTLLLLLVSGSELAFDYGEAESNAQQTTRNLTRLLAAQTEAVIGTVDQALHHVVSAMRGRPIQATPDDPAVHQLLYDITAQVPFLRDVYVFDAKGDVVQMSAAHPVKPFNVADREYFRFHRDHAGPDLFIGPPVLGRLSNRWLITLTRRLDGPDGRFAGVALCVLDPDYLQRLYDSIDIGKHGIVSLLLLDGRVLAQSPFDDHQFGTTPARPQPFEAPSLEAMLANGQRAGIDRGRDVSDGRVRIGASRIIKPGPLVVRVAVDEDEILEDWYWTTLAYAVAILAFIALMALLINLLRVQIRQYELTERARRESERLAYSTIDALTGHLCVLDDTGTVIVANRAWRFAAGNRPAPAAAVQTGSNFLKACDGTRDRAAAAFAAGIRAVMAGERTEYVQEHEVAGPDGQEWYAGRVTRFAGSGPNRVVVLQQNITERRLMENALRQSERRLAKAQAIAHLGNWEEDLGTGAVCWSDEIYRIFGCEPGALAAGFADYLRMVHPDDRKQVHDQERRLATEGQTIGLDHRIVRPDGAIRFVNLQAEPIPDSGDRPPRAQGIVHDVTDRKLSENALRQAILEVAVANRAKTEFLATMSHELNTPLNAVIGFSELMASELCGPLGQPKYREFAQVIHHSGRHLQQTIADILDIAKVNGGEMPLDEEYLDMAALVQERVHHVEAAAATAGVALRLTTPVPSLGLIADRHMVKQVLRNLLSNAIKFTPAHGSVTVSLASAVDGRVALTIADTGIGMAPEDIPRALDRFFQLDGTLARQYDGTGLGLSLAKALVEKHGGTLEITSALGRGTTVEVWFPAERVAAWETEREAMVSEPVA